MQNIKISLFGAVLSLVFLQKSIPVLAQGDLCSITKEAMRQASSIRGLKTLRPVPCVSQDKDRVKEYILHTIKTKLPRDKIALESLVYKALGFIPESLDYKDTVVRMYTEQIGGYYDPEKKRYVMAAWMPAVLQFAVTVHELTHALQDQHYDLGKFTEMKSAESDMLLARSALVEGDATAVMLDYTRKMVGQPGIAKDENMNSTMMQNIMSIGMLGGLKNVPESLKVMLIFPYTSGLSFVHALLKEGGYRAVDRAFKHPPRSTEEIMHVEKFKKRSPDFIEVSDPEQAEGSVARGKIIYRDVLGEFAVSALFSNFIEDRAKAAAAAQGWGGDKVVVFENPGGTKEVVWKLHWDSQPDAEEFFNLYRQVLRERSGDKLEADGSEGISAALVSGAAITLKRNGSDTTISWR